MGNYRVEENFVWGVIFIHHVEMAKYVCLQVGVDRCIVLENLRVNTSYVACLRSKCRKTYYVFYGRGNTYNIRSLARDERQYYASSVDR
jgi:hypothetical protein